MRHFIYIRMVIGGSVRITSYTTLTFIFRHAAHALTFLVMAGCKAGEKSDTDTQGLWLLVGHC